MDGIRNETGRWTDSRWNDDDAETKEERMFGMSNRVTSGVDVDEVPGKSEWRIIGRVNVKRMWVFFKRPVESKGLGDYEFGKRSDPNREKKKVTRCQN